METQKPEQTGWTLRVVLLLLLGAASGLAIHLLLRAEHSWKWTDTPWRTAFAAFLAASFVAFAFSFERLRWRWSAGFALVCGLVVGLVTWTNGPYGGWGSNEGWQLFSCLLAVAIAVPLFQTARDEGRFRLDYEALHAHSWTNILLWGAAWAFVLASFLMAQLLAELFSLIGLHQLRDLLRKHWSIWLLVGSAFGAAIGLLRDRDIVLRMLRRVATAVISVLTPLLAAGLLLFVLALPFTGLESLWSQTKETTPILMVCVLGAFILVNTTIGNGPAEEPRSRALRYGAMGLAVVMLPLAMVAAISMSKRIGQYGYTPDRLWALVFVGIALVAGLLYVGSVLRSRRDWPALIRRANIGLALGLCGLALLLALPILSFGGISARNQLARLEAGKVTPDKFDWMALRFDFGPGGRRALERLARSADPRMARQARLALSRPNRWPEVAPAARRSPPVLKVVPAGIVLPAELRSALIPAPGSHAGICQTGDCHVFWKPGQADAIVLYDRCAGQSEEAGAPIRSSCAIQPYLVRRVDGGWRAFDAADGGRGTARASLPEIDRLAAQRQAIARNEVEIRPVSRRQLFLGGRPEGEPFE